MRGSSLLPPLVHPWSLTGMIFGCRSATRPQQEWDFIPQGVVWDVLSSNSYANQELVSGERLSSANSGAICASMKASLKYDAEPGKRSPSRTASTRYVLVSGYYWLSPVVKTTLENHLNVFIRVAERMGKPVNALEY